MNQRALKWIAGNDTGTSSKTLWSAMMGVVEGPRQLNGCVAPYYSVPCDPADFGRCHRLLLLVPEWRKDLAKVAEIFPAWKPLVDNWPELERLYMKGLESKDGKAHELYKRMQVLNDEGRILDGWKQTGKGSWSREQI